MSALPDHLPPRVRSAVAEARVRLADLYGDRLLRVVLYGSYARGSARPDSDVDLLVVLDGEVAPYVEIRRTGALALGLLLRHGVDVSMQPFGDAEVADLDRPLMAAVRAEGVEV